MHCISAFAYSPVFQRASKSSATDHLTASSQLGIDPLLNVNPICIRLPIDHSSTLTSSLQYRLAPKCSQPATMDGPIPAACQLLPAYIRTNPFGHSWQTLINKTTNLLNPVSFALTRSIIQHIPGQTHESIGIIC